MSEPRSTEGVRAVEHQGEAFAVSECHGVPVSTELVDEHDEHDWKSVRHVCSECGEQTLIVTNPQIAQLHRRIAELEAEKGGRNAD